MLSSGERVLPPLRPARAQHVVPLRPQSEGKKSDIAGEAGRIVCPGPTRVAFGTPATRTAVYAFALLASFKRSPSM